MAPFDRRQFLSTSGKFALGAAAGAAWLGASGRAKGVSANDKLGVAVVGLRGRGGHLAIGFAMRPDCEVRYLADVDTTQFGAPGLLFGQNQSPCAE
jgi:hypothetical protein